MSSLYQLAKQIAETDFDIAVDPETGEILYDSLNGVLDEISLEFDAKIENIALFIKNLDAEAEALKKEEDNLKKRRKQKETLSENLARYLSDNMKAVNMQKFETAKVKISFRKSTALNCRDGQTMIRLMTDEEIEKFIRISTVYDVDKMALKKYLQSGHEVAGASIAERSNIQIR